MPVIAARSSSLVEFALPPEMYFDPYSVADFSRAFRVIETMPETEHAALAQRLREQAASFTWEAFAGRLLEAVAKRLPNAQKFKLKVFEETVAKQAQLVEIKFFGR